MIPKPIVDEATQAITALRAKPLPTAAKPALDRLMQVFETWAADDDTFVPIDFSEADLKEAALNLENALKKDIVGFEKEIRSVKGAYIECMNDANDSDDRIKCRSKMAIGMCEVAASML